MKKLLLILTLILCMGLISCTDEKALREQIEDELYTSLYEEISSSLEAELRPVVKRELLDAREQQKRASIEEAYEHYFVETENIWLTDELFERNIFYLQYDQFENTFFQALCEENNIEINEKTFDDYFVITVSAGKRSAKFTNEAFYGYVPHSDMVSDSYFAADKLNYYAEYDLLGETQSGYYIVLVPRNGIRMEMIGWESVISKELVPVNNH